jgi:hypothetical protein
MPEAAVDENRNAPPGKYNVRAAFDLVMHPVAKPGPPERLPESQLG